MRLILDGAQSIVEKPASLRRGLRLLNVFTNYLARDMVEKPASLRRGLRLSRSLMCARIMFRVEKPASLRRGLRRPPARAGRRENKKLKNPPRSEED